MHRAQMLRGVDVLADASCAHNMPCQRRNVVFRENHLVQSLITNDGSNNCYAKLN